MTTVRTAWATGFPEVNSLPYLVQSSLLFCFVCLSICLFPPPLSVFSSLPILSVCLSVCLLPLSLSSLLCQPSLSVSCPCLSLLFSVKHHPPPPPPPPCLSSFLPCLLYERHDTNSTTAFLHQRGQVAPTSDEEAREEDDGDDPYTGSGQRNPQQYPDPAMWRADHPDRTANPDLWNPANREMWRAENAHMWSSPPSYRSTETPPQRGAGRKSKKKGGSRVAPTQGECSQHQAPSTDQLYQQQQQLAVMLQNGQITPQQYQQQVAHILQARNQPQQQQQQQQQLQQYQQQLMGMYPEWSDQPGAVPAAHGRGAEEKPADASAGQPAILAAVPAAARSHAAERPHQPAAVPAADDAAAAEGCSSRPAAATAGKRGGRR